MSFQDKTSVPGRQAASILELELDRCIHSYGTSPCTAVLGLQNFFIRSDEFDNAAWNKQGFTVTANQDTHPILADTTVDELLETAVSTSHRTWGFYASSDPTKIYTASFVVKGIGRTKFRVRIWNQTVTANAFYSDFDISNGTITAVNQESGDATGMGAKLLPIGTTGYYRLLITGIPDTLGAATDGVRCDLYTLNPGTTYLGDITKGAYVCAAQLREGSFPGKYAPTAATIVDGMGTVDDLCFNTFGTCQDTPNYTKAADPAGTSIDYEIVFVDEVVDTPDTTWADVGANWQINQGNLVDGDDYLIVVKSFIANSANVGFDTNFVRLVDESGVELTASEYQYEAASITDKQGYPYGYVNWFTANPTVGTGLIKMQAQFTSGTHSVKTSSLRAFCLNLTQLGTDNYVRARNTTPVFITLAGGWTTCESITLPAGADGAGDWMIFGGLQCGGFNGGSDMPARIIVDATTTLVEGHHDIDDSTGTKVHMRWAVLEGAVGGEVIDLEMITRGGVSWNCVASSLVAVKLDAFGAHFLITGDPTEPSDATAYDALTENVDIVETGDYVLMGSLTEDFTASANSGAERLTVDASVVSGDHDYVQDFSNSYDLQNKFIFPNGTVALTDGETSAVVLNRLPATNSPTQNAVSDAYIFGFLPKIPSPDPDPTLRFVDAEVTRPVDLIEAFPSITGVRYGATRIQPGGRFSVRGTVSVTLQDFSDNDAIVDDYQGERSYDPETMGTFFGKLKERSKYYVGRPMRVLEGYLDAPFSLDNFRTRDYIIENIAGPTADGKVTIQGKDILALARDDRAKAPTASTGTLAATLTAGGTTITVSTGDGDQYPTGSHIRINDEIILVGTQTVDSLTGCTRAEGGTTAAAHAIDDAIQLCLTYDDEPVIDVIFDLLTTYASIDPSFIPTTSWAIEEGASLTGYDMTTIISAPTGVTKLLQEICAITLIDLWYSDVDREIKLKLQTPFTDVTETWTDDDNFLMDSVKVKDLNDARLSRSLIYYGMRNFAEKLTEPENFNFVYFEIEADKEGVNKYDDEKIRTTFSRWFDGSNSVQVALTSQRLLDRFGITPVEISFDIDAKDVEALQTGDVYDAQTRVIQDVDGSPKTTRFQVIETKPKSVGSKYTYKSLAFFQDPTPDTLTINQNETNYDVFVELGGPPGPVDVTLTVNTTFDVDGDVGSPAITTVGMHPDSTLHLINNGDIRGTGGNAGSGGNVTGFFEFEPGLGCIGSANGRDGNPGGAGGDAIYTTIDITIDNTNGNIWAGAGGGGGGGTDGTFNDFGAGGGGGGGIGTDTGNAGSGGTSTVFGNGPGCSVTNNNGVAGTAGTTGTNGTGGAGGGFGADGGDGGADWGDDGDDGDFGVTGSGGAGGAGGFAVRLNGASIIWEGGNTAAKVKGDVA